MPAGIDACLKPFVREKTKIRFGLVEGDGAAVATVVCVLVLGVLAQAHIPKAMPTVITVRSTRPGALRSGAATKELSVMLNQ